MDRQVIGRVSAPKAAKSGYVSFSDAVAITVEWSTSHAVPAGLRAVVTNGLGERFVLKPKQSGILQTHQRTRLLSAIADGTLPWYVEDKEGKPVPLDRSYADGEVGSKIGLTSRLPGSERVVCIKADELRRVYDDLEGGDDPRQALPRKQQKIKGRPNDQRRDAELVIAKLRVQKLWPSSRKQRILIVKERLEENGKKVSERTISRALDGLGQ